MLKISTLIPCIGIFSIVNALAIAPRDTSCPNGQYTDDLHQACHNGGTYGDGQCYNNTWLIQCTKSFNSADVISFTTLPTRATGEIFYPDTCLQYCQANAPGFTAINIQFGESSACDCLRLASSSINDSGNAGAHSMVQIQQSDCCEPYTGDLGSACTADESNAQGKCVTINNNPFIINCNANSYRYTNTYNESSISTLADCVYICNKNAGTNFNAINLAGGLCQCSNAEDSFNVATDLGWSALFQTTFPTCGN